MAETIDYVRPSRVLTRPLARAPDTADVIARHAGLAPILEPRLTEAYTQWDDEAPVGVEPAENVVERVTEVLGEQVIHLPHGPVVLVSHNAVIALLLDTLDPARRGHGRSGQRTACWSVLSWRGEHWAVAHAESLPSDPEPGE